MPKGCNTDMLNYLKTLYTLTNPRIDLTTAVTRNIKATGGDQTKAMQALVSTSKT